MSKSISRHKVHKFREERSRQKFLDSVTDHIEKNGDTFRGYVAITEVDLMVDQMEEGAEDLKFIVSRKEVRPSSGVDPYWNTKIVPAVEAKSLERVVPEMRAEHLPPVNSAVTNRLRYPETDIMSSNDYVLFAPKATVLLDELADRGVATPSFDAVEHDIDETRNRPTDSLRESTQKGIKETKNKKADVLEMQDKFQGRVSEAIRQTVGGSASDHIRQKSPSTNTMKPSHLLKHYERLVKSNQGEERQIVKEHNCDLNSLEKMHRRISQNIDDTEDTSVDAFSKTIDEGGMKLPPNSVDGTEDAIDRLGIGKRSFLGLDD